MSKRHQVRIGVFIPSPPQLLDVACIDTFAIAGHAYLSGLSSLLPAPLIALAPDVHISYIATSLAPVPTTAQVALVPTHTLADPAVAPGTLHIVYVPGPDPAARFGEDVRAWLRAQAESQGTDVLSVCTGVFVCGEAGILKGRKVSGPRGLQKQIRERFEGVEVVGDEFRWVRDGNLWSSGGITNGNDLVAAYIRQSAHFPGPVAEAACTMADVGDRGQKYREGQAAYTVAFVWQLLKAWVMGVGKAKAI